MIRQMPQPEHGCGICQKREREKKDEKERRKEIETKKQRKGIHVNRPKGRCKDQRLQDLYGLILSDKCGETVNSSKRKPEHSLNFVFLSTFVAIAGKKCATAERCGT